MKKRLIGKLLFTLFTGLTFSGFSQCPNPDRIEEDFSTTSGQTPPNCWTVLPTNNLFVFDNSRATMYGTDRVFILPNTTNTKGQLTFRATHLTNKTYGGLNVLVGVYNNGTFTQVGSASYGSPGWKNFSFDFSSNNVTGNIAIKTSSNSYTTRIALDDIVYQSQCIQSDSAIAKAKDITVQLTAAGTLILNPTSVDDGSIKSCLAPITNLSLDKTLFTCAELGPNTVKLIADDDNGHKDTATAIVTVEPAIGLLTTSIHLDSNGVFEPSEQNMINTSTSTQCSGITYTFSDTLNCSDVNTWKSFTVTATYPAGTTTYTKNVYVSDYINPIVKTQNLELTISSSTGKAEITPAMVDNGSSDVCGIASLSLDKTSFTCDDVGENIVTLTVTDNSGRTATGTATITVKSFVADVNVSSTDNAICFDGVAMDSATISTDVSTLGVSYYLRNDSDSSVVKGPIAGTGSGLSFNTGGITGNKSYHVYAEVADESKALNLSANNDYLLVNTPGGFNYTNGYTFSAWIKASWVNSSNAYEPFFYAGGATGSDVEVYVTNTSSKLSIVHNRGNGSTLAWTTTNTSLPTNNEYFHIAITYDGSVSRVYVNGSLTDTKTIGAPTKSSGSELTFGYLKSTTFTYGQYFNGLMDDIRVYDHARSENDIQSDMSSCLQGTESNLVLYFPIQTSTANIVMDKVSNTPGQVIGAGNTITLSDDNAISCEFTCNRVMSSVINVGDFEKPTALAKDVTVALNGGTATIVAGDINNGSNDNCTSSGNLVLSVDQSSFTISDLGANTVKLVVEDENGNKDTAVATITVVNPTSVARNSLEGIKVYPNPTKGVLNIEFAAPTIASIKILDLGGKVVKSYEESQAKSIVQLHLQQEPGLYFVEINDGKGMKQLKLVLK